jgi:AAA+ superfamily predicted ATPase
MTNKKHLFANKKLHKVCLVNDKNLPGSGYLKIIKAEDQKIFKILRFVNDPFQREDLVQIPEYFHFCEKTEVNIYFLDEETVPMSQQVILEHNMGDQKLVLNKETSKIFTFNGDEIHLYINERLNVFRVLSFFPDFEEPVYISDETNITIVNSPKHLSKEEITLELFNINFEQTSHIQFIFDLPKCLESKAYKSFFPKFDLMEIAEIPELEDDHEFHPVFLQDSALYYVFFADHIHSSKTIDKLVALMKKYQIKLQFFMTFNELHPLYLKLNNYFECSTYFFPPLNLGKIKEVISLYEVDLPATKFVGLSLDDIFEVINSPNMHFELEKILENNWSQFGQVLNPRSFSWNEIIGYEKKIEEIRNYLFIQFKQPEMFKEIGLEAPKGILLYGPSGCGKTLIARTLATENLCTVIEVLSVQLYSKYFGETEERIRRVFSNARLHSPCILIFDEFDSFGIKRSASETADTTGVSMRVLTTFLTELDGIHDLEGVTVIACTSKKDTIDEALLRPGRLDLHIEIDLPDSDTRLALLKNFLADRQCSANLSELVEKTNSLTAGKIKMVVNNAIFNSLLREDTTVRDQDFE